MLTLISTIENVILATKVKIEVIACPIAVRMETVIHTMTPEIEI